MSSSQDKPSRKAVSSSKGEAAKEQLSALRRLLLRRDRVLALDQGLPVLVIEGPSGYGKSTLAGMWLDQHRSSSRVVWVSLDMSARDPIVFLDQLMLALGLERPIGDESSLDDEAAVAERFAYLTTALVEEKARICLVMDDVHLLAGSRCRIHLERLLQAASDHLRICLTMQPIALEIGLGSLTSRGQVSWVHAGSLAFTEEEVAEFAAMRGQSLSPEQSKWLFQVTEGWPAIVQLALAVPLRSMPAVRGSVAGLGPIREFIYERFIQQLSAEESAVMWTLACLGNAPVQLLYELDPPAERVDLALLRFCSLGIVQTREPGNESAVYLHAIIREAALRMMSAERMAGRQSLMERAAQWHWSNGNSATAVRLMLDPGCGRTAMARDWLIEMGVSVIFRSGLHQTLLDLIEAWEQVSGGTDPGLDRIAAWALIFQRRFSLAEVRLERSSQSRDPEMLSDDITSLQRAVLVALRDDYVEAGLQARRWLDSNTAGRSVSVGIASTVHAFSLKCAGKTESAHTALREAHLCFSAAQYNYGTVWAHVVGALALVRVGRYRAALAEVDNGLSGCPGAQGFGSLRTLLRAIEAFLRYERNELDAARDILDEALPQLAEQGIVDAVVLGYTAAARARCAAGDFGTALDILVEGEQIGVQRDFLRLTIALRAERALVLSRSGASSQARMMVSMLPEIDQGHFAYQVLHDRKRRLQARLAVADGDGEAAREILLPLISDARAGGRQNKLCELLLLQACTEDLRENEPGAFLALSEALELGCSEGFVRMFIDEGRSLNALIRRWRKQQTGANRPVVALATSLLAADGSPQLAEGLDPKLAFNKREAQILRLLDEGLSNAQIAARCFISEGTVKWYLHNLYEKLGVGNRTALLRAARARGIKL